MAKEFENSFENSFTSLFNNPLKNLLINSFRNSFKSNLLIILLSLFFICTLTTVSAADHSIDNATIGGIKDVLSTANNGDTIYLQEGIYKGTNNTGLTINKTLTFVGNGSKDKIILDAENTRRIFSIGSGINVVFINITFFNGKSVVGSGASIAESGGAIYNSHPNSSLTIINSVFTDNNKYFTNYYYGGAIFNSGDNMNIINSTFNNNNAGFGGAIYNEGNNMTIVRSVFNNNSAWYAAIVHNLGYNSNIINSTFNNNNGSIEAGIYSVADNLTIINSVFNNNTVNQSGVVYSISDNLTIINCTFFNNNGQSYGAVINNDGDNLKIINSSFLNNTIVYFSGIVYNRGDNLTIINSNFINNNGSQAVIANGGDYSNIINSTFDNNKFTSIGANGSAIRNAGRYLTITTCLFTNNFAGENGGAIFNYGSNLTLINSIFINNTARLSGGAIFNDRFNGINTNNVNIINSTFTNNNATYGGAIFNFYYTGNAYNLILSGNRMNGNTAILGNEIYNNGTINMLNLTYLNNSIIKVKNNTYVVIHALLTDDMGNLITGQNISFYVNGLFVGNATVIEGRANLTYMVNHNSGIFPVSGNYTGQGISIINNTGYLRVYLGSNISLNVDNIIIVGKNITIKSRLTDDSGNAIVGAIVDFYVNGKKIGSAVTDNVGIATLKYIFKAGGNYDVSTKYSGNGIYTESTATNKTKIIKINSNNSIDIDKLSLVGKSVIIKSRLTDDGGNAIVGAIVDFYVNGKKIGSAVTDNVGIATLKYIFKAGGNYDVSTKYSGNGTYTESRATNKIRVIKIDSNMDVDIDGDEITITLVDGNGKPIVGKEVVLRDFKGRVLGLAITNSDGQVTFAYTGNEMYLKASFTGNDIFKGVDVEFKFDPNNEQSESKQTKNLTTSASMKKTGMPIILVLIVLLSILGIATRKNRFK